MKKLSSILILKIANKYTINKQKYKININNYISLYQSNTIINLVDIGKIKGKENISVY